MFLLFEEREGDEEEGGRGGEEEECDWGGAEEGREEGDLVPILVL